MKMLIALILALPVFVFAKDTEKKAELQETKVPVKEGYGTMNMDEFKGMNKPTSSKSGVSFTQGCKGKTGIEYKESDPGYEGCLREAQMDNAAGNKNGSAPSMGVNFGN